jgi:hypothetical protein
MVSFHSSISPGSYSRAFSKIYFLMSISYSFLEAYNHSFSDLGIKLTALDNNALVLSGGLSLAASSHISSLSRKF